MRLLCLLGAVGCTPAASAPPPAAPAPPAAFGGERAVFGETPGGAKVAEGVGRCQNVPALDRDPLLADFEQDSVFLRPVPERYGVWFMTNDGSPDGKQEPESFASARGGYNDSNYAMHYKVQGFTEWGGVVGFAIRYSPEEGIRCPFNASAFTGLSFMARGRGRIRVNLAIPETMAAEQEGGRCQRGCWDNPGAFVFLKEEWTEQRIPWSAFAQQGWGTVARLNLREVLSVNFSALRDDQPVELWLDDVKFMTPAATATSLVTVPGTAPAGQATR